jgi:hypothetical protein
VSETRHYDKNRCHRIDGPIFNSKEAAEQHGLELCKTGLTSGLRFNDEQLQLCKFLNEKRDMATSSRLIPLLDDLTHILIERARTNCTKITGG